MLTPKLVVTNIGLNAANHATPTGPWIYIKKFKIYTTADYEYDKNTTEQLGDLLYEDIPLSYRNIGDNTLDIVCMIPAEAGPFQYGSIGLYVEDTNGNDVLFAIAVYDNLQMKYSSLGSNVASSSIFHCLLRLEQSTAIFKIDTLMPTPVQEVDYWHEVLPPSRSANEYPLLLVREKDPYGRTSLLHVSDGDFWTVGTTYPFFDNLTVKNATRSWIEVNAASLVDKDLGYVAGTFVLEVRGYGVFRYVESVTQTNLSTYRFNLSVELQEIPPVGSALMLHRNDGTRSYYDVELSRKEGNLLQQEKDGLYYGEGAPDNIRSLYIDAVNGNDNNTGTRASPLKTIKEAVDRGPGGVTRDLYLYEGQQHLVEVSNRVQLRGGKWGIFPYGPAVDALPPVPGNSKYAQLACINLNTRIVASTFESYNSSGANYQRATAIEPLSGAYISPRGITFVAGSPNSSGYPVSSDDSSFSRQHESFHYDFYWCRFSLPHAQSALIGGANFASSVVFLGGGNPIITGQGRLVSRVSEPLTVQLRALTGSGVIGTSGRTLRDYLPSNLAVSSANIYNFNSDLDPGTIDGGGGGGTWVTLARNTPAPGSGHLVLSFYGGEAQFIQVSINGTLRTYAGAYYHDSSHYGYYSVTLPILKGQSWNYVANGWRGSVSVYRQFLFIQE